MHRAARAYLASLKRLAALRGVRTSYTDAAGHKQAASTESVARVLAAIGSLAGTEAQASASEVRLIESATQRRVEPVTVAWLGRASAAALAVGSADRGRVTWTLALESGETIEGVADVRSLKVMRRHGALGEGVRTSLVPLPRSLPAGYHRMSIAHGGQRFETMVIASPVKSYRDAARHGQRAWGLFCPAYALRSQRNLGVGDLSDLRELAKWADSLGGCVVATLPLLACHLGERPGPFDPSPYAPVSRMFWNELSIDPRRTAEFERCDAARRLMSSSVFSREAARLRRNKLVDYRGAATLKRTALAALADCFYSGRGERSESFRAFIAEKPMAREYALFRGATEKRGEAWVEWPSEMRRRLRDTDADSAAVRYHLYAQYAAWLELIATGAEMQSAGGSMYLDLPVGVSGLGFDAWKYQGLFAPCSTGAPPDPYFTRGQNWGFPPMHPDACREDGYAYLRECLRSHMRHADYLRLDHVMAFHRLFWIPEGMPASDGVYVRYRDEEMYAVLCLESHRNRCRLVGENLGTVPPEVDRALARHDVCGLFVGQYEMRAKPPALRRVPADCVASVNTHDMPPFRAWWSAADVGDRVSLKMLDAIGRRAELAARRKTKAALVALLRKKGLLAARKTDAGSVRDALLMLLAESPAELLLVSIEDLWLETRWQNVPGTTSEHPNWRRKLRFMLEEIASDAGIERLLRRIDSLRRARPERKTRTTIRGTR